MSTTKLCAWGPRIEPPTWTPPQPERVSDEDLEGMRQYYDKVCPPYGDALRSLIEAERARRAGDGKK